LDVILAVIAARNLPSEKSARGAPMLKTGHAGDTVHANFPIKGV
jgi:hypothetical protein